MIYCGLDVASKSSCPYVTTKSGRKLMSGEVETTREGFEKRLRRYVRDGLAIAVEAGNQTAWIYKALVEMGAKVTVVNPTKVRMIAERPVQDGQDRRQNAGLAASAGRLASPGAYAVRPGSSPSWTTGGPPAADLGPDEAVQRGPGHGPAGRDAVTGEGIGDADRLEASDEQRFQSAAPGGDRGGVFRDIQGFDDVDPRYRPGTGRERSSGHASREVADNAEGGPDGRADVSGRRGRSEAVAVGPQAGRLFRPGTNGSQQR